MTTVNDYYIKYTVLTMVNSKNKRSLQKVTKNNFCS